MTTEKGLSLPDGWPTFNGTAALFRTLEDLAVITSVGTGALLYDRSHGNSDFVNNLMAASLATSLGLKSVDRVRREYIRPELHEEQIDPARARYVEAYREAMRHIDRCRRSLSTNKNATLTLGMYAGSVAMERLEHSFFAAHVLYQLRLRFEADAVARVILEQIAWSVAIAAAESHEDIDKHKPQSSINALKSLVTRPHPGRLYGALSQSTHADADMHQLIFDVDAEERGVIKHGITDWTGSAGTMLILSDLWVIAYEAVQHDHLGQLVSTNPGDDYRAVPERDFLTRISRTVAELQDLEGADEAGPPKEHSK